MYPPPEDKWDRHSFIGLERRKFDDEAYPRGHYHFLVSVKGEFNETLITAFNFIARECAEKYWFFKWREVFPRGKK